MVVELAGQHADRQREVPAQPGDLGHGRIAGIQAGPGREPDQEPGRVRGRLSAGAAISSRSSASRPVKLVTSRGSVRVAAAIPPAGTASAGGRPRAAASNAVRAGEAQRLSQQLGGVLARRRVDSPLEVTNRPGAQPGRLGQLLLRQVGLDAQPPEQLTKRLRHVSPTVSLSSRSA